MITRLSRAFSIAVVALAFTGCRSTEPTVEVTAGPPAERLEQDLARLKAQVGEHPGDMKARFELGAALEAKGLLEGAAHQYAIVARGLPAGKFTRPSLCLGRVELALGRDVSGKRALEDVLAVVPDDPAIYASNPDYQEAALLLGRLLLKEHDLARARALEARYTGDFQGDPELWPEPGRPSAQ